MVASRAHARRRIHKDRGCLDSRGWGGMKHGRNNVGCGRRQTIQEVGGGQARRYGGQGGRNIPIRNNVLAKVREERSLVSAMAWHIVRPQLILTTIEPQSKFIASMRPREGVNVRHPAAAQAQPTTDWLILTG